MLNALYAVIRRHNCYAGATFTRALLREGGALFLLQGKVHFHTEPRSARKSRIYPNLELHEEWLSVEDAERLIETLEDGQSPPGYGVKGDLKIRRHGQDNVPFSSHDSALSSPTAAEVFSLATESTYLQAPTGPLAHLSYPVYISARTAVEDWIGSGWRFIENANGLIIVAPEPRGALSRLRITNERLEVYFNRSVLSPTDLSVRIALRYDELREHPDLEQKEDCASCLLPRGVPTDLQVFLLDNRDGSIVDLHHFRPVVSTQDGFLTVDLPTKTIVDIIAAGEGQSVELKRQVNDALVTSITAFANTDGGVAIVGVDDDRAIVGLDDAGRESSRLIDMLNTLADPIPTIDMGLQSVHGEMLIVIRVPKGENAPYTIRTKGTMVRRSDRNVPASRADLDRMYKPSRQDRFSGAFRGPWG